MYHRRCFLCGKGLFAFQVTVWTQNHADDPWRPNAQYVRQNTSTLRMWQTGEKPRGAYSLPVFIPVTRDTNIRLINIQSRPEGASSHSARTNVY